MVSTSTDLLLDPVQNLKSPQDIEMVVLCFFVHQCFSSVYWLSTTLSTCSLAPEVIIIGQLFLNANQIFEWKKLAQMDQISKGLIRLQEQDHAVSAWLLRAYLCWSAVSGG